MSGIIQSTMLSGLSPSEQPAYNLYFEEFGTIMREVEYFNIKYDKAYPALYARIAPTVNRIKSYAVSGFMAGAYGAEFLIFNATDTAINLDETSGNYLSIHGVTFTNKSDNQLTVDDHFSSRGSFSDPITVDGAITVSPLVEKENFNKIKSSRVQYGRNEFTLDTPYIQSQDDASNMMQWLVSKIMNPRLSVGLKILPNSTIQLGDILTISLQDNAEQDLLVAANTRFVVYNIDYSRDSSGPEMTIYLSEVA
mgnify:FL=1